MFKVSDKVKCIDNIHAEDYISLGNTYTVAGIDCIGHLSLIEEPRFSYRPNRFELIEKENTAKETKQFNPKPGDLIVCNNGEKFTCCTRDFLKEKGCAVFSEKYGDVYGYYLEGGNETTGVAWISPTNSRGQEWKIKEVIPQNSNAKEPQKEKIVFYTEEDIRKAWDDLSWLDASYGMLMESLKKVTSTEYKEYLRLKAMFENDEK